MMNSCLLLVYLSLLSTSDVSYGARILSKDRTIPVIGQPPTLTYNNNEITNITNKISFMVKSSTEGVCLKNHGKCGSAKGNHVTRISSNVIALEIPSFNAKRHAGAWIVFQGSTVFSNYLNLTPPFAVELLNTSIHVADALPTQEQIDSKADFNVSISIDCTYPTVNMYWVFGKSQTLAPVITTDDSSCTPPQKKTFGVLTMKYTTVKGRESVTVQLVHPSFENGVRNIQIGYAVFPDDPERMSALSAGAISGIVIAVVLALAIPTVWILYKRKIKKKAKDVLNESNN
ncbi:uncharacterized protein LOC121386938 [Gigantopelta aegis]|uniref:uncharacterized protein LOC121386938 n=1 Tax=Gigantopelta aegis TaxID=1735272 RepID=UPI001B88ADF0|nr:uncharacterized protein LOC121386938 [Gigantopelta aegis]